LKKWSAENYTWTETNGISKNVLKIYSKLLETTEFKHVNLILNLVVLKIIKSKKFGKKNGRNYQGI
jgi:hypothetical protein